MVYSPFSGGLYNDRLYDKRSFPMLNPLPAVIVESIANFSKYWFLSISFLSDTAPLYAFETKFINEFGVPLISTF